MPQRVTMDDRRREMKDLLRNIADAIDPSGANYHAREVRTMALNVGRGRGARDGMDNISDAGCLISSEVDAILRYEWR